MAGPSLGTNMAGLEDWSTAFPFVNQFLMTRNWFTQSATQWDTGQAGMLDLDENGWVRGFTRDGSPAPFQSVTTIWQTNGTAYRPGVYVMDWAGAGDVTLVGADVLSQADGRLTFRVDSPDAVIINIRSTDPGGTGDYIRDMRLYHSADADLIEAGMVFNPAFLERVEDFRVLRFMDWAGTNNSTVNGVEDMRPFDAARQTGPGGASLEMMVELANQTRTDPWFCIPHLANNAYIRAYVSYVNENLDPGLVARFELSNEVWNWSFAQAQWAQKRAEALWGTDVEGGWMQWYGMRAAQMAQIVAAEFGAETGTRALNVFSTQGGWQGLENYALNAPEAVADGMIAPRDAPFHIYAIAPYFGGALGQQANAALIDQWIGLGNAGYKAAISYLRSGPGFDSLGNIGATIAYHANVAAGLGWQLEGYEGGQHIVDLDGLFGGTQDPQQTEFFINLVRRPEFQQLYTEYFQIWKDNGGGLMTQFSDIGLPSRYGSWGIWDSVYSPDTPRSIAVQAFRDGVEVWWSDNRPEGTFIDGLSVIDTAGIDRVSGSIRDDHLFGLTGQDSLYGKDGDDLIHGGAGNDLALGGNQHDTIMGGLGLDTLYGGAGNDTVTGGSHADQIFGGIGDDRITGGSGFDTLTGGIGADSFVFNSGDSYARITDFQRSIDKLVLAADLLAPGDTLANVIATYASITGSGVLLTFGDGTRIHLEGLTSTTGLTETLMLL